MTGRLAGKVAVITGGGVGIGEATARRLAAAGAKLVVTGRRLGPLESVAREIGGVAIAGDIGDPATAEAAVTAAVERFGGLDIMVANAGVAIMGDVADISIEDWRRGMQTNLDGAMFSARAAVVPMRQRGGGSIIFISSVGGIRSAPRFVSYVTTKTALIGLARSIAYDFGPDNIRANAICPGWISTEMAELGFDGIAQMKGKSRDEVVKGVTRLFPLRRLGEPREIAACVEFLASDDASFVTGSTLVADGGDAIVEAGTSEMVSS